MKGRKGGRNWRVREREGGGIDDDDNEDEDEVLKRKMRVNI